MAPSSLPPGTVPRWRTPALFIDEIRDQAAIGRADDRIAEILESTTDCVYTLDEHWRFTYLNARAIATIAQGRDLLGQVIWEAFPNAAEVFWDQYHCARGEQISVASEVYFKPLSSWFEVHAHPYDHGISVFFRDITPRKKMEEELRLAKNSAEQASLAKSAFLANMSHELRTPLNAVVGFSDILRVELLGPHSHPSYKEYAEDIFSSGQHLLSLINDILDLAKIEAGAFSIARVPVDIAALMNDAARTVTGHAERKGLQLILRLLSESPSFHGDRRALMQILLNLLSNAIKFTDEGQVILAAQIRPDQLVLSVMDTGIGMSVSDLARIGRPFVQAEMGYSRQHQGTGIGLAIVRRLTELHDGRLEIESTVGVGTTVSVLLPRAENPPS